jgi:hypothetical protein
MSEPWPDFDENFIAWETAQDRADLLAWESEDDEDPEDDAAWAGQDDEDDEAAWLRGLPDDVRADYLAGAWTGAGESEAAGFLHHADGPSGRGFAGGGA